MTNYEPSLSSLHIELSNNYFTNNLLFSSKSKKNERNHILEDNQITISNFSDKTSSEDKIDIHSLEIINKKLDVSRSQSNSTIVSIPLKSSDEINENFKIYSFLKKYPCISFSENQPIHNRLNFRDRVNEIYRIYPEYQNLTLKDITDNSYFSILWSPTKSSHNYTNNTSFLVFYRFRNKYLSNSVKFVPVIGLLTNKLDEEFWLINTNLNYNPNLMNNSNFNKILEDYSKNKYKYSQVIVNKMLNFSFFVINL